MRILSGIKKCLVPEGAKIRKILGGPCRGLLMEVNLKHQMQMWLGLYERELHPYLRRFSKDIRTGIDVGTAEGYYSLFMLGKTSAKKVFSFEPLASAREEFRCNLNSSFPQSGPRLELSEKLVSENESQASTTLDKIVSQVKMPCLVKMDVEGAEASVLKGASGLLALPDVRLIVEVHSLALEMECIKILEGAGYQVRVIPNAWWRFLLPEKRFGHNRWLAAVKKF
jgi:hypothetical protein